MKINSSLDPAALYLANQTLPQSPIPKEAQERTPPVGDQAVTVAISAKAQALQKVETATKTEASQRANDALAQQVQTSQQQQNQRPAGQSQRIDLTV